jgi:hypothetical protein
MGMSGGTTQKTKTQETAVTKPNTPAYAQPAITGYYNQVADMGKNIAANPSLFTAPINDNFTSAVDATKNLGGWRAGLTSATNAANSAGGSKLPTVTAQQAAATTLGPAPEAQAASLLDRPIEDYMNPFTQGVVDTTLAGFDDNSGRVRAAQAGQAAKSGAFGGSRMGIAQAQTEADLARERASTESGLRFGAFDRASQLALGDANNRQQTNLFNTGTQAQYGITGANLSQDRNFFNAGEGNDATQFNAGLRSQEVQNRLQAAQIAAQNATSSGSLAQGDAASQIAAAQALQQAQQQQAQAPLTSLAAYGQLLDPALLASVTGQTINSNGTSTTKQSGGLLGQLLGAGAQLGGAAILASDRRVKRDIERIGELPDGLGVYSFRYNWDADDRDMRVGVMADEVADLRPHALGPVVDGVQTVNYSEI